MATAVRRAEGAPDLTRSSVSRYIQLATLFRRRIETRQWLIGEQIPTVDELAEECGVARATVRQALGLLEGEGLIERFRAKGTFVRAQPQARSWCAVGTDMGGLLRARDGAVVEILLEERGVRLMGGPPPIGVEAAAYRHIRRRHAREGQAFLLGDTYIEERVCAQIPRASFKTKTALRLINDVPGMKIGDAQQTLTIGTADVTVAETLGIALNAPVAKVDLCVVDAEGTAVLAGYGIYRGDVVRIDTKLV